jgi:hypothetical protein
MASFRGAILTSAWVCLVGLLGLSGCRTQPMLTPSPIRAPLGAEQNRQAILHGMAAQNWQLVSETHGLITAVQDKKKLGKYVATVDIAYDDDTISISYRSSHGLSCEPADEGCTTIHRAYNRWVIQLARNIEQGVGRALPMAPTD